MEPGTYYNVVFDDEWLGVENFKKVRADSEQEARDVFEDEVSEDGEYPSDRYNITEVVEACTVPDTEAIFG